MTTLVVHPGSVAGTVSVPGDKSVSHRALMLAAIAEGTSSIANLAPGLDVASTVSCLRGFGIDAEGGDGATTVTGRAWSAPSRPLDCGNSGTTMRLLTGLAAHHGFTTTFDGDASLRRRPMDRIAEPLRRLGARVEVTDGRYPPLTIEGGDLRGAEIVTPVPSAQVKSCLLFAALGAQGPTAVVEAAVTRDHTERMLAALGADVRSERLADGGLRVEIGPFAPRAFDLEVPGDPSSAAFPLAAAALCGEVIVEDVMLNPTRTGFLDVLGRMGAGVDIEQERVVSGEPRGRVRVTRADLRAVVVEGQMVPTLHDEIPLIAVLATQAEGTTTVRDAAELRVKEADRIAATVEGLSRMGARIEERPDGFVVVGPTELRGADVEAHGDHRMAMALAVAGLVAGGTTRVHGFEAAEVSWPRFPAVLSALGAEVEA